MIPTRSKSKLSKLLSYPIGAEVISEALADAPFVSEIALSFHDKAMWPLSEFQRHLREGLPYQILSMEFTPVIKPGYSAPAKLIERGWFDAKWSVTVYPVLRELRQVAGQLLREQGLPIVWEWMHSTTTLPGWEAKHHKLRMVFHPTEGSLVVERHNKN